MLGMSSKEDSREYSTSPASQDISCHWDLQGMEQRECSDSLSSDSTGDSDGTHSTDVSKHIDNRSPIKLKRLRANHRERTRVNLINSAMEALRNVVPEVQERPKITKLELLRCANRYIWMLNQSLLTGKSLQEIENIQCYYQMEVNTFQTMQSVYGYR